MPHHAGFDLDHVCRGKDPQALAAKHHADGNHYTGSVLTGLLQERALLLRLLSALGTPDQEVVAEEARKLVGARGLAFSVRSSPEKAETPAAHEVVPASWTTGPGLPTPDTLRRWARFTAGMLQTTAGELWHPSELARVADRLEELERWMAEVGKPQETQQESQEVITLRALVAAVLLDEQARRWSNRRQTPDWIAKAERILKVDPAAAPPPVSATQALGQTEEVRPPLTPMPNPTGGMKDHPAFEAIWRAIKSWDVNVPEHYDGYCGATGSHVALIMGELMKDGRVLEAMLEQVADAVSRLRDAGARISISGTELLAIIGGSAKPGPSS